MNFPNTAIQEASAKLGIPIQKLRRWDDQGVLVARRTDGGHRRYARELIDRLAGSSLVAGSDKHEAEKYEESSRPRASRSREKRRIIQLLLESENRYRDLVETSHDLIWTTDAQGRFTYLNNGCARHLRARDPRTSSAAASSISRPARRTSPTAASSPRCAGTARSRTT